MTGNWEASLDAWKATPPPESNGDVSRCDACGEYVNEDELTPECDDGPAFCRGCVAATRLPRWEAASVLAERMRRGMR